MSSDKTYDELYRLAHSLDWVKRERLEKTLRVHFNPVVTKELMDKYPYDILLNVCHACDRSPNLDKAMLHTYAADFNNIMNQRKVMMKTKTKPAEDKEDWSVRIRKLRQRKR